VTLPSSGPGTQSTYIIEYRAGSSVFRTIDPHPLFTQGLGTHSPASYSIIPLRPVTMILSPDTDYDLASNHDPYTVHYPDTDQNPDTEPRNRP
jgi:hypothetical protein